VAAADVLDPEYGGRMSGEPLPGYGLIRPTVADALVAVHRVHGPAAAAVWQRLLTVAGLRGDETDDRALRRLIEAMTCLDPLCRVCARSLTVRLTSYDALAATVRPVTAGSVAR
jgi:hypothetical protein